MTFTAARVNQELAKEGILPWAKFFGQSKNLSFGRFLLWIQKNDGSFANRHLGWLLKQPWMDPREHYQEAPFGALSLHWTSTVIMILATIHLSPADAYTVLVNLYSYTIIAVFGCLVAIGMLKLRFSSRRRWREKSDANPFFSVLRASLFLLVSAYPIIASWVPPTGAFAATKPVVSWFTTPTVACSILGAGGLWYVGFNVYAAWRARKDGVEFHVQKVPEFDRDGGSDGLPVQVHETVYLAWAAKETNNNGIEMESRSSRESF